MKNIVIIAIVLAIAGVLGYAAMGPATFNVQRSIIIKAGPEKIHPYINDFHKWTAWSPYEKMAPVAKREYTGPASGKGSMYNWVSSNGWEGQMAIEESTPEKIVVQQVSSKPMKAKNITEFLLNKKDKDSTEVVMSLHMDNSYMSKLLGIFMNRDKMMGAAFEDGLAKLKQAVEKEATAAPAPKGKKK
jgi:hypothetical protein